jgi:hypothetical protein
VVPVASRLVSRHWSRPVLAVAAALAAALTVAGCVSMPSAGPVASYPVTQGTSAQAQPNVQFVAGPPQPGWNPAQVVEGFLSASGSFGGDNEQVAGEYLTPQGKANWKPTWSALVYKDGPNVGRTVYSRAPAPKPTAKASASPTGHATAPPETATVTITGKVEATLSTYGSYAVPSTSNEPAEQQSPPFQLVKDAAGQWRISYAPSQLLLTAYSFTSDYQLRNLYFFDPQYQHLVADPVYVPLQATTTVLMDNLVKDLIIQPHDWLYGATKTAFPAGTALQGDVTLDGGTAVVNLVGTVTHAGPAVMGQASGQLIRTLLGAGQGGQAVQSIEVLLNGKPWPSGSQDPVQSTSKYTPASGANGTFYYLGTGGKVFSQAAANGKPVEIEQIAKNFDQIAVSRDGNYLAAVTAAGDLYSGPLGGKLVKRGGSQYTSISWGSPDPSDDLWATTNTQVVVLLPGNHLVTVSGIDGVTALAVAPDGVRVAMIIGDEELAFGAIWWHQGSRQTEPTVDITLSQLSVQTLASFDGVTWYGPDNVITLANPGPAPSVTEYPVNGGSSTTIPAVPGMQSISASSGSALIAGLVNNHMAIDASLTGTWLPLTGGGTSPVYPG